MPTTHTANSPTPGSAPGTAAERAGHDLYLAAQERIVIDLLTLARNATLNAERSDLVDYWYRLGQRNAHAQAAGLLLAQTQPEEPAAITERIERSLDAGVSDLNSLRWAAYGLGAGGTTPQAIFAEQAAPDASAQLAWIGPKGFEARWGHLPGMHHDYGFRWGPRGEQRISLRLPEGADSGLLYVYDPTWDQYAVLSTSAARDTVEAAFHRATQIDIHLDPRQFTQLVKTCDAESNLRSQLICSVF